MDNMKILHDSIYVTCIIKVQESDTLHVQC